MKKIIAIASQKGGVGKTTTALNLGYSLSMAGEKVLIIDGDPQGGVALSCGLKAKTAKGLVHALRKDLENPADVIEFLRKDQLAVAGVGIEESEDIDFFEKAAESGELGELIKMLAADFDYVLIDAPVGVGSIVKALLAVSDSYIVVINCKAGTVKSLPRLIRLTHWLKNNVNERLELQGILTSMFNSESESEVKIYNHFKARLPAGYFFSLAIPNDPAFEAASIKSLPVAMLNNGKELGAAYMQLALEIQAGKSGEADEEKAAQLLAAQDGDEQEFRGSELNEILKEMCEKNHFHGAVVADEMGFPLADHQSPLSTDALAAFTSVLGDSLEKANSILDVQNANNISMDISENDKLSLRKFEVLNSTYFLITVCPLEVEPLGVMEVAVSRISTELS